MEMPQRDAMLLLEAFEKLFQFYRIEFFHRKTDKIDRVESRLR